MKSAIPALFILLSMISCTPVGFTPPENPDYPETEFIESSELFPGTSNTGEFVFITNNTDFIQPYGMTFWTTKLAYQPVFTQLDVTLNKSSGNKYAGFGLIFCHGLRGDPAVETMLLLMINLNQEYIIGEVIEDKFTAIVPWTSYLGLNPGFSQENRVKISFNSLNEEYEVYINNMNGVLMTFTDNDEPIHRSGSSGFITVISPLDRFPEIPVQIIFKNNN